MNQLILILTVLMSNIENTCISVSALRPPVSVFLFTLSKVKVYLWVNTLW